MTKLDALLEQTQTRFGDKIASAVIAANELTLELASAEYLREICVALRDEQPFQFNMLVDISGVDYLQYGAAEWETQEKTATGFSRAVTNGFNHRAVDWQKPRFAVVYHLLSLPLNHRIRLRVFLNENNLMVDSVINIWQSADWYEREAFDLFGILFQGHPDLRRILTDYGFIGHPFRKDFPLIGNVEMRYDAQEGRCIYEAVSIQPRTLVPKVIRHDNRYSEFEDKPVG